MNRQHPSSRPYAVPLYDTTALSSALANPYAQHYAPHYYQACLQAYSNGLPRTTRDGYTLSSTYVPPDPANQTSRARSPPPPEQPSPVRAHSRTPVTPIRNHLTYGSWFQPGNCRCTRQGCPFTGSRKSVEIHMMDRHFIFPSGWKKKSDWDADPSLRGKPIAIQGTSLVLDTPEAIGAWIAERKRRYPTERNVRDRKRKLEEAAARGQLTPEDIGAGARKKPRHHVTPLEGSSKEFRGRGHRRGRGRRWQGQAKCVELRAKVADDSTSQPAYTKTECGRETGPSHVSSTDDEGAPEIVSSKVSAPPQNIGVEHDNIAQKPHAYAQECSRRISLPKKLPRNPFASRSTLLRNLLLPEIRVTVSNLSQAIHFLVENDFLRNVEVRPGETQERMIEVLKDNDTTLYSPQSPTEG